MKVPQNDLSKLRPVFGWTHDVDAGCTDTIIRCPNGHIASLRDHAIGLSGTVVPSVQCPKCAFHENVVLENFYPHPNL